ncbi:MAG: stage II sporulation protein D [Firmicutes bacterium]|nr:stage II sporulation protein D [Bacillota bacterium]
MRRAVVYILTLEIVIMLVLPAALVRGCSLAPSRPPAEGVPLVSPVSVRVFVHTSGRVQEMPLEDYVAGVVAAEMPASFGVEALKAQAVAARTYVVKRMRAFGGPGSGEHPGADICTDPGHGQAWISEEQMRQVWGPFNFGRYHRKVQDAVASTSGLVLTYRGAPIDPVYHSTCGGVTEEASEVWKDGAPYLKSVRCDYCRRSPYFAHAVEMQFEEIGTRLGDRAVPVFLKSGKARAEVVATTVTGRVKALRIGETVLKGQDIRSTLGLPSTRFTVQPGKGSLRFALQGKGHGVGMCQYGADGLAREGKTFSQILAHYYSGVEVRRMFVE